MAAHERASAEVERLMDLVENAIEALSLARKTKQKAQRELDSAALEAKRELNEERIIDSTSDDSEAEYEDYTDEEAVYSGEESVEFDEQESDPDDGFDLGDSALEQIRYRLETAKIDPGSPEGAKVLDKLLLLLQASDEPDIDENVVNDYIDEVLCAGGKQDVQQEEMGDAQTDENEQPRIRISRGNKVLGWYEGELDAKGYAREGKGSSKLSRLVVFTS